MSKGDYRAAFELTMARKDVRLMIESAAGRPLAVLPAIAERMDGLIARGFGGDDLAVCSPNTRAGSGARPSVGWERLPGTFERRFRVTLIYAGPIENRTRCRKQQHAARLIRSISRIDR